MARVLVLSDTHLGPSTIEKMPEEVWSLASSAGLVLHAGDVVHPCVLDALRAHADVVAVLGNNDRGLERVLPDVAELELGGVRIGMIHDSGARAGRERRMRRRFPDAGVVVFGHSHDPLVQPGEDGQLLVNPGSPTQRRRQPVHTVALLGVGDGEVQFAEIVPVGPLAQG